MLVRDVLGDRAAPPRGLARALAPETDALATVVEKEGHGHDDA